MKSEKSHLWSVSQSLVSYRSASSSPEYNIHPFSAEKDRMFYSFSKSSSKMSASLNLVGLWRRREVGGSHFTDGGKTHLPPCQATFLQVNYWPLTRLHSGRTSTSWNYQRGRATPSMSITRWPSRPFCTRMETPSTSGRCTSSFFIELSSHLEVNSMGMFYMSRSLQSLSPCKIFFFPPSIIPETNLLSWYSFDSVGHFFFLFFFSFFWVNHKLQLITKHAQARA